MTKPIRWLHLSDFHFGTDEYGEGSLSESIIEHIRSREEGLPDLIFLTGDIGYSGRSGQYEQFEEQFFRPLMDLLGPQARERTFMVPGNHDLDRKTHELIHRTTLQQKRPRSFDPTEEGRKQRNEIVERFSNFALADFTGIGGGWLEGTAGVFTHQLQIHGINLGILGLNTAWHCQDEFDNAQITPGANLVKEGLKQISDSDLRVVLGHHPIEWFRDDERISIERLFREQRIIYLHGHMHKSESNWKGWPGKGFLTVQAGAAFQAREDEQWKNRILYATAQVETKKLWVEPFTWSRKEGWVPEGGDDFPSDYYVGGRWGLPIPCVGIPSRSAPSPEPLTPPPAPDGWQWLDFDFLSEQRQLPDKEAILAYYDGRIPSWAISLSPDVPKRTIVTALVQEFLSEHAAERIAVRLICGAGGEGKTTAIMQIAASLIDSGWRVLWRRSDVKGLPNGFVNMLPDTLGPWLIVTDDADLIALDLYENARKGTPNVHFLLAARDTDWSASMDDIWRWSRLPSYRVEVLNGLKEADAQKIVDAWARYGAEGLGDLASVPHDEAAKRLASAAQDHDARFNHDGAFLGAMLKVRKGTELREHVASLLERLSSRSISFQNGSEPKTMLDAMAYIAAMHSENLLFLSKPVLSKVLGCKPGKLKSDVLGPLGEEAAAGSCGKFILTRHRAIADVAMDLLQRRFHYDPEELYVELTRAAREVFLEKSAAFGPVPEISKWNFISDHFFDDGQEELGIRLAMALVEVEPTNAFLICKLAQLYRVNNQPAEAINTFRKSHPINESQRPFFNEWATCEGSMGNFALNIWLDGLSLSDQAERRRLDAKGAPITLAGLSLGCLEIFKLHPNLNLFIEAASAAAHLGLALEPNTETQNNLSANIKAVRAHGIPERTVEERLQLITEVITLAWEYREDDLPQWFPDNDQLGFSEFRALFISS